LTSLSLKAAFHTLGCKVNYFETESLKGMMRREGFEVVPFHETADVYVINTCTVTHLADRKSRQAIRRARRQNPGALVAVIGCYVQASPAEAASIPGVDLLLGTRGRLSLPQLLKRKIAGEMLDVQVQPHGREAPFEELPPMLEQGRTRAFLKIQEGCSRSCSYCIVPAARGPLRSLAPGRAVEQLREISRAGFKEVVLTGVQLGLYGVDLQPQVDLASYLRQAVEVEGIERLRLSSIEPGEFSDSLVEVIAEHEKICRHLHIPLQSGDDEILWQMRRPYDSSFFRDLLKRLREMVPDLAVSSDIIVGFPGETEDHFQRSLEFVRECAFSRLHIFKFSPRRGTAAEKMSLQVPPQVKEERRRLMAALGEELSRCYRESFSGSILSVLFEKKVGDGIMEGLTSNYLRVRAPVPGDWRGRISDVIIVKSTDNGYLEGTVCTSSAV